MPAYLLHVPAEAQPGDPAALDRAEIVKDGFAWWALFVPLLWFLWHRLWLGLLGIILLSVALTVLANRLDLSASATFLGHVVLVVLIAFEANAIRSWTLSRRGKPVADVVVADDVDEATAKAFARWLERRGPTAGPGPAASMPVPRPAPKPGLALGLFPEPEARR